MREFESSRETDLFFKSFERVVNDGAIGGAVGHLPHAVDERAGTADQVGKILAGVGARFIDGAFIPAQENAASLGPLEDASLLFANRGVVAKKNLSLYPKKAYQLLNIAFGERRGSDAAAIGASEAIDTFFDFLRDDLKPPLHEVVALEVLAQALVLLEFLFAESADLDQIGQHTTSVTCLRYPVTVLHRLFPLVFVVFAAPAQERLPAGPGRDTVKKVCSTCHSAENVAGMAKTRDEWGDLVGDMVARGAQGTSDDFNDIVDYLTAHFPPRPKINVNKATASDLETDLGLPAKDAAAIVEYREAKGNFKSLDDLRQIPGIDFKKIAARRDRLAF